MLRLSDTLPSSTEQDSLNLSMPEGGNGTCKGKSDFSLLCPGDCHVTGVLPVPEGKKVHVQGLQEESGQTAIVESPAP